MLHTFVLSAKEVKQEKNTFIACSAKLGDTYYKIKFTRECEKAPKTRGLYDITIDEDKCSIQRGKKYTTKDGYDAIGNHIIWVREIAAIRKYTDEELAEINRAKFAGVFAHENSED